MFHFLPMLGCAFPLLVETCGIWEKDTNPQLNHRFSLSPILTGHLNVLSTSLLTGQINQKDELDLLGG